MKRTILGLLSLVGVLLVGCTQPKVKKSESLREAYFQISKKVVIKEKINSTYIKNLLSGYKYEKGEELKIEGGNIDGSDHIQQPYIFTDKNESLTITHLSSNSEEQLNPFYTIKEKNGETNLSILIPDVEDSEIRYMYTANRDNLKDHKAILEKLDKNEGTWYDTYLKVIYNVCSSNDINITTFNFIINFYVHKSYYTIYTFFAHIILFFLNMYSILKPNSYIHIGGNKCC